MSEQDLNASRTFSYDEASALLPEVRRLTEEARERLAAIGVTDPAGATEAQRPEVEQVLADWARAMNALGIEVKGIWLVDFDNGSGYYCWRHPEPGLHYYHSYDSGFRGRMRIQ